MPDTFTFEDAQAAPESFSFEEAQAPAKQTFTFEDAQTGPANSGDGTDADTNGSASDAAPGIGDYASALADGFKRAAYGIDPQTLNQPFVPLHRETPEPGDSGLRSTLKALYNVKQGFGEFLESPVGAMTTIAGAGVPALARPIAGAFAADMARNVPGQVRSLQTAYKNGTTQDQIEAGANLALNVPLATVLAHEAVTSRGAPTSEPQPARTENTEFADSEPLDLQPAAAPDVEAGNGVPAIPSENNGITHNDISSVPVQRIDADAIATRPDLMQFKKSDDTEAGTNEEDKLAGKWDDLKGGNLLLWEPKDPKAYGLEEGEKYIVANGHHRFEFGEGQDVPAYNAQIVSEAEGVTPQDARKMAAEINIADGKGTVYDQVKFLRNETANPDEALQRIGPRGAQAGNIAFNAGEDLYTAFVNEKVSPEKAEAIAKAAPSAGIQNPEVRSQNESLQRLGVRKAMAGAGPQEISNLIQAVRLEAGHMAPDQLDLFGANDSALQTAETLGKIVSRIQNERKRERRATENAVNNATTAKVKGIQFTRPLDEMKAENAHEKAEDSRWDNWALHPDLVAQVRGYAEMARKQKPGARIQESESASASPAPTKTTSIDDKLKALKIDTQGKVFDATQALIVQAINGSLDIVRGAIRAGKAIGQAIEDGWKWIQANHGKLGIDENEWRGKILDELGVPIRQAGRKVQTNPEISPDVKTGVTEYSYLPKSNESTTQAAQRIVKDVGMDKAIERVKDDSLWHGNGPVQSQLYKTLLRSMGEQERLARAQGNAILSHELVGKQIDLQDYRLRRSTDVAQALQAMSDEGEMSPAAIVGHAKRTIAGAGDAIVERMKPALENIKDVARQANAGAVEDFKHDPEVQAATRKAVDADVAVDPEVHKAVVMELAGPWASSPEILRQARELVREKANDLLKRPNPDAVPASQRLKVMLDDLSSRAAGIAANHFQGAEPGVTLKQKFMQRLGLTDGKAEILAKAMENEFKRQVNSALTKLPKSIATQRARANAYNPNDVRDTAVDREIYRQIKLRQQKLGAALTASAAQVDATGKSLVDRVMDNVGLENSDALRAVFNRRWDALVARRKASALNQLLTNADPRTGKTTRQVWEKIVRLSNLGAFSDQKYYDAVREGLKLPVWSDDLAREITRRANDLQTKPEGMQRDDATRELYDYIATQKGVKLTDLAMSFWYANTLSGTTTPHIGIDNLGSMAGNALARALRDPGSVPEMVRASGPGARLAASQVQRILTTGKTPNITGVVHPSRALELSRTPILNQWKYVGRTLSAAHMSTFMPMMELKSRLIGRDVARSEGLTGAPLRQRVADIMADGPERIAAAKTQAAAEGLTGNDARLRTHEIIAQQREQNWPGLTNWAQDTALRATYLNPPYGLLGTVGESLEHGIAKYAAKNPARGMLPRLLAPFVRVPLNIVNEHLNYTPVGSLRALWSKPPGWWPWEGSGELYGQKMTPGSLRYKTELADLHAKTALGAALTVGVAAMVATGVIGITGNGPASSQQRQALRKTGWIPNAFKIGDHYVSFARLPGAMMFAAMGHYFDSIKYKKLDQMDAAHRLAYTLRGPALMIAQQPYLEAANKVVNAIYGDNQTGAESLSDWAAQSAAAFVVPRGLMQLDKLNDPTVYDSHTVKGLLMGQVPYARRLGQPVINGLGDPVQAGPADYDYSPVNPDPIWTMLAAKQADLPNVGSQVIIGDKKRGPNYYKALTDDERYKYSIDTGHATRKALANRLNDLWRMDDDTARATVSKIAEEVHREAKAAYQ